MVRLLLAKVGVLLMCVSLGPRWCERTTEPHVSESICIVLTEVRGGCLKVTSSNKVVVRPCVRAKMFNAVANGHT